MGNTEITLDPLLTPSEAADYRGTSVAVLAQERYRGVGPKFIRDGRRIRYRTSDLAKYIDACTQTPPRSA